MMNQTLKCMAAMIKVGHTITYLAWVPVEAPDELNGPAFIYKRTEKANGIALSFNVPLSQVETSNVEPPELPAEALEDGAVIVGADLAPLHVHQVWIANKLSGLEKWTLKSAPGTFLASDRYGSVTATNEARGPQEEWAVKLVEVAHARTSEDPLPDHIVIGPRRGIAFQSPQGKWLALDQESSEGKKRTVRADASEIDDSCVWEVSVQWKYRHAIRHAQRAAKKIAKLNSGSILDEERISRSRQGWNAGSKVRLATGDRRELEQAKREGRLSEAMLDRRQKLKSDKYAW
ncbi:hypothetical protein MPSI1_002662 [Malassezia psittaci]|uniref:Uncharacterized protein n=1 Tax=Malassezia psittaci TaxID=1821823 RepID=A0AAF0FB45_9BASI|nr:hypothetical protein MPSI1_002662 [Malassezia psittaci]